MPHSVGKSEDVGDGLWRLLVEDIHGARHDLSRNGPAEERVHRARQRLKRARSVLGVLKPALGAHAPDLKRMLAEIAKELSSARDADVAAATARNLRAAAGDSAGLDPVVAELDLKAEEAHRRSPPPAEVIAQLTATEEAIRRATADVDGPALVGRALVRAYTDGRKAMRSARSSLATPDLHGWRKKVKHLWHIIRIARKRLPRKVRTMADRLDHLGEVLGLDHDHAVLAERLALSPHAGHSLMRQLSMIAAERRELEKEAFARGKRLYSKKPKGFARRARVR